MRQSRHLKRMERNNKNYLKKLSDTLLRLKAKYPEKENAAVPMEPKIEYDYLVQVMDTVRGAQTPLIPKISIGDAP